MVHEVELVQADGLTLDAAAKYRLKVLSAVGAPNVAGGANWPQLSEFPTAWLAVAVAIPDCAWACAALRFASRTLFGSVSNATARRRANRSDRRSAARECAPCCIRATGPVPTWGPRPPVAGE